MLYEALDDLCGEGIVEVDDAGMVGEDEGCGVVTEDLCGGLGLGGSLPRFEVVGCGLS